jgi:hypothetical protein
MKNLRGKSSQHNGNGRQGRHLRTEPPLHAASLSSPIFVESWNGGSPLNWVEFMGRWEMTRIDRDPQEDRD